ncbi:MAG: ATP-binding protein, partial [Clostridia bacterium]
MLLDEVAAMMERYAMVRPGGCLLAAVSGGADSVAMLYLLQALQPRLHFRLEAVHFEHGIRGETSKADAR